MSETETARTALDLLRVNQSPCRECGGRLTAGTLSLAVDADAGGRIWVPVRICRSCGGRFAELDAFLEEVEVAGLDPAELSDLSDWRGPLDLRVRSPDGQIVPWDTYRQSRLETAGEDGSDSSAATFLRLERMRELERGRDSWAVGWRENVPVRSDSEEGSETAVLALVVDEEGTVRAREAYRKPPGTVETAGLLERAVLEPEGGKRRARPRRVFAGEGVDAAAVEATLGEAVYLKDGKRPELVLRLDEEAERGVEEKAVPGSPQTAAGRGPLAGGGARTANAPVPSFLAEEPREEIRRFYEAAERILAQAFWSRFEPGSFLGVRIDGHWWYLRIPDPWRPGFSILLFEDWLHVASYTYSPDHRYGLGPDPESAEHAGVPVAPVDRIRMRPVEELAEEDRKRIEEIGVGPVPPGWSALVERHHSVAGVEGPGRELALYADLLGAMAEVLEIRGGEIEHLGRTVSVGERDVRLVHPPRGREALPEIPGVRFVLRAGEAERSYERVVVRAPAKTRLEKIVRLIRGILDRDEFQVEAIKAGDRRVYLHELASSSNSVPPVPVGLLLGEPDLRVRIGKTFQPAEVDRIEEGPVEEVEARVET